MSIEEWQARWDAQWSKPLVYHTAPLDANVDSSFVPTPLSPPPALEQPICSSVVSVKDPLSKIAYTFPHSSPYFPDNYHIVISLLFHCPPSQFVCYELHAARLTGVVPENIASFRVYAHKKNSTRDEQTCRYASTLLLARQLFLRLCRRKLKAGYQPVRTLSHGLGSRPASSLVPTKLSSSIYNFLERTFAESAEWLKQLIPGTINNGLHSLVGTLSQQQLLMGQSLLAELFQCDLSYEARMNVQQQYYALIPHHCPKDEMSIDDLYKEMEILATLQSMISLNEASGPLARGMLCEIDMRYKSLQYVISPLDPRSTEYAEVRELLNERKVSDLGLIRVFRLHSRHGKSLSIASENAPTRLFHGCSWSGLAGILSRGLLLPTSVLAHGGTRTDYGLLGSGIYFSSVPLLQYCVPSTHHSHSRIMLVCDVQLGNSFQTPTRLPQLTQPPEGFQSVHAVGRRTLSGSQFEEDEFVVYDESQQEIVYAIEFVEQEGPSCHKQLELVTTADPVVCPSPPVACSELEEEQVLDAARQDIEAAGLLSPAGLLISSGGKSTPVPLGGCYVRGTLVDLVGEISVLQQYNNDSALSVEARYVFPLQEGCAVTSFEAYINDKKVVGVVRPKAAARKEYRAAVAKGHGAYLMEQVETDVFSVSVGNLPANCSVVIKLTYVCELQMQGSKIELCLPAGLAPTAAINVAENTQLQATTSLVQSKTSSLNISISLDMPYVITDIQSVNHDARVKLVGVKGTIDLETVASKMDVILLIGIEKPFEPRMWVEMDSRGDKACLLAFYPSFTTDETPLLAEVTFLLDLSESMAGHLDTLRSSLEYALTSLLEVKPPPLFNLVAFGSTVDRVFLESVPATKSNISRALLYLRQAQANFGATNLLEALQSLYEWNDVDAYSTHNNSNSGSSSLSSLNNIVLLTDGELANESEVVRLIRKHRHHTRLFVIGVGGTQTRATLRALAQEGAGRAEVVQSPFSRHQRQNHAKITQQLKRMQQEALYDIEVEWLSLSGERVSMPVYQFQAPCAISSLFENERLLVFGFIGNCFSAVLRARSTRNSTVCERRVDTGIHSERQGSLIHRLCARRMIKDYEDEYQYSNELYDHERIRRQAKQKIEDLAMSYSLVSPFTSYLAIEERQPGETIVRKDPNVLIQELLSVEAVDQLSYVEWTPLPASTHRVLAQEKELLGGEAIVSAVRAGLRGQPDVALAAVEKYSGLRPAVFEPVSPEFASALAAACKHVLAEQRQAVQNTGTLSAAVSQKDCVQLVELLQSLHTLAEAEDGPQETRLQFLQLTAQCFSHLALLTTEFNTYASQASELYETCLALSRSELSSTHPLRMSIVLNYVTFLNDVMDDKEGALALGKASFDEAISSLDCLDEDSYKDSTLLMQILRDQLSLYSDEAQDDCEEAKEGEGYGDEGAQLLDSTGKYDKYQADQTYGADAMSDEDRRLTPEEITRMINEAVPYSSNGASEIQPEQQEQDEGEQEVEEDNDEEDDEDDSLFVRREITYHYHNSTKDILLIDVTPLSLGFELNNGLTQVVIGRNCTIPCRKEVTIPGHLLIQDNNAFLFPIVEGERARAVQNHLLATLTLDCTNCGYLPTLTMRVKFDLDANGILTVTAEELQSGATRSVVITNDKGRLSKDDIEQMICAEKYAAEDQTLRYEHEISGKLDAYSIQVETMWRRARTREQPLSICFKPWAPEGVWGGGSWKLLARKKKRTSESERVRCEVNVQRSGPPTLRESIVFTNSNIALKLAMVQGSDGSWRPEDVEAALGRVGLVREQLALAGCLSVGNPLEASCAFSTALAVFLIHHSLLPSSPPASLLAYLAPLPLSSNDEEETTADSAFVANYYQPLNEQLAVVLKHLPLEAEIWLPCLRKALVYLTSALQQSGWLCQHLSSFLGRGCSRGSEDWLQLTFRVFMSIFFN